MKHIFFLVIISLFFSACVQNTGPGEPPYVKLVINDNAQAYDSIQENENYTFYISYIEENGAEFNEIIVSEGQKTFIINADSLNNENLLEFNFTPNYNVSSDSIIDLDFVASCKNSGIISKYDFDLVISPKN